MTSPTTCLSVNPSLVTNEAHQFVSVCAHAVLAFSVMETQANWQLSSVYVCVWKQCLDPLVPLLRGKVEHEHHFPYKIALSSNVYNFNLCLAIRLWGRTGDVVFTLPKAEHVCRAASYLWSWELMRCPARHRD